MIAANPQILPPLKARPLGDTLKFPLTFQASDGSLIDLTGANFEIGLGSPDGTIVLRKQTSAYTVTGVGAATAALLPSDTAALKGQTYDIDFVLIEADGTRSTWISKIPLLSHPNTT